MNRGRLGEEFATSSSPAYDRLLSAETSTALGVAAGLFVANIALMIALAFTPAAEFTLWLYTGAPFAPIPGLIVFGAVLSLGRYAGLKAISSGNELGALGAVIVVEAAYGAFGAGILSLAPQDVWIPAIGITGAITTLIAVGAAAYVYTREGSFEQWAGYSTICFIAGIILYVVAGSGMLGLAALLLFIAGFVADLVYELWRTSDGHRSPVSNGFAVYIAVMGVFVHILQLVLEALISE